MGKAFMMRNMHVKILVMSANLIFLRKKKEIIHYFAKAVARKYDDLLPDLSLPMANYKMEV